MGSFSTWGRMKSKNILHSRPVKTTSSCSSLTLLFSLDTVSCSFVVIRIVNGNVQEGLLQVLATTTVFGALSICL